MMNRGLCFVVLALLSPGCIGQRMNVKSPPERGAPLMSYDDAKKEVLAALTAPKRSKTFRDGDHAVTLADVRISQAGLDFGVQEGPSLPGVPAHCDFATIEPEVRDWGAFGERAVLTGPQCGLLVYVSHRDVQKLCDAFYTLKHTALGDLPTPAENASNKAAFEKVVADYRARSVKPALPEDARRFKIQAEAAVREKRYDDAVDLYDKGLQIAPWWPEGHYNRALLLGESGRKQDAIAEMKKYLELEPHAPDARAAQDKIYEWGG